jgi:hypothetical protein
MSPENKNAKEPYPQKSIHVEYKKLFVGQLLIQWQNQQIIIPTSLKMIFLQ